MGTRTRWIWFAGLAWAGGCNAVVGIEKGTPYDGVLCSTLADCAAVVEEPDCRAAHACEQGRCIFKHTVEGSRLAEQTAGDCVDLVCDGMGNVKQIGLPADVPDDGNPCTVDACEGTRPVHEPLTWLPCYSGPVGTEGKGICTGGVQHCDAQGNPIGGCEGEVLPKAESCISPLDDDCDGQVNEEGAGCIAGDAMARALQERTRTWR